MSERDSAVQMLLDQYEIERVIRLYCRAVDRLDVDLIKTLYHEDAIDSHGPYEGNAHEFAEFIVKRLRAITTCSVHTVSNSIIDVDGDRATAETSYFGYVRVPGGRESLASYFSERYADQAEADGTLNVEHEFVSGGRYLDRFERRDGGPWKISRRDLTCEWTQSQVARHYLEGGRAVYDRPGARDRTDPVYSLIH